MTELLSPSLHDQLLSWRLGSRRGAVTGDSRTLAITVASAPRLVSPPNYPIHLGNYSDALRLEVASRFSTGWESRTTPGWDTGCGQATGWA